ncbi:periplasmic binding protein-like I [Obelidium mucronatum]|nr:periplasmic binding protein-like I [Obelidium mucronatum]
MAAFKLLLLSSIWTASFANSILGFFPGSSSISAKQDRNLTIAFILPYNYFWAVDTSEEYEICGGDCSFFRQMDSAAELVVQMVNNNTNVLPNTMVNILRVHEWDTNGWGLVGDIAPATLSLVDHESKPVAAYGTTSSVRGSIAAGVLSQFRMPFCAGSLNSPSLSNKQNYPYFFRPTYGNTWGKDMSNLFSRWNVKRIGMVFDSSDEESRLACVDIKAALFSRGMTLLTSLPYKGNVVEFDFNNIMRELSNVDARYIVVCAQGWSQAFDLVVAANHTGLISKDHVWTFTNVPYPADLEDNFDPRLELLNGIVVPGVRGQNHSSPNFLAIDSAWNELYNENALKYQNPSINWASGGPYDCVGTILYGLDKAMKSNPDQSISNLKFNSFTDSGFKGANLNPLRLDSSGDLAADTTFATFSHNQPTVPPFVIIGKDGEVERLKDPVFTGSSSIPPWDGSVDPLPIILSTSNDTNGRIIISLIAISYVISVCLGAFVIWHRNHACIKTINPSQSVVSMMGSFIMMSSTVFFLEAPTPKKCYAQLWLFYLGITILVVPLLMKNWYILRIFSAQSSMKLKDLSRIFKLSHIATAVATSISLALLVSFTETSNVQPKAVSLTKSIVYECIDHNHYKSMNPLLRYLTAYCILLIVALVPAALAVRNVNYKYNDSSFLIFVFMTLSLLSILKLQLGVDENVLLKKTVYIFIAATHVPTLLIGPKVMQVFKKTSSGNFATSIKNVSSSGQIISANSHTEISTTLKRQVRVNSAEFLKLTFTYRIKNAWFESWHLSKGILFVSIMKRQWIAVHSRDGRAVCFPWKRDEFQIFHTAERNLEVAVDRIRIQLEFDSNDDAKDFLSEASALFSKFSQPSK